MVINPKLRTIRTSPNNNNHVRRTQPLSPPSNADDGKHLTLWRHPWNTACNFLSECVYLVRTVIRKVSTARRASTAFVAAVSFLLLYPLTNNSTQDQSPWITYNTYYSVTLGCTYWFALGVLSSIGLGSGLHTFVLYLGPHIARITQAAYECNTVAFPQPPYPDKIICPTPANGLANVSVHVFDVVQKVWLDSFMWALGTAAGELPPFLLARRHGKRNRNTAVEDGDIESGLSVIARLQQAVKVAVERYGFWAIFLSACVPNPLFDVASMACGNFGMPVWKFLLATALGKAGVKINVQILAVVMTFSKYHAENLLNWLQHSSLLVLGRGLGEVLSEQLIRQKQLLHPNTSAQRQIATEVASHELPADDQQSTSFVKAAVFLIQNGFSFLVAAMIGYFAVTVVNSMAQDYYTRQKEASVLFFPKTKQQ